MKPRNNGNFVNADRSSRKTHGVTNFVTTFEREPDFRCVMGYGNNYTPTVWMEPDHPLWQGDEWERVQEMRKKSPGGLVAGGRANIPGDRIEYKGDRPMERGLRGAGQGIKNMKARHYCSN